MIINYEIEESDKITLNGVGFVGNIDDFGDVGDVGDDSKEGSVTNEEKVSNGGDVSNEEDDSDDDDSDDDDEDGDLKREVNGHAKGTNLAMLKPMKRSFSKRGKENMQDPNIAKTREVTGRRKRNKPLPAHGRETEPSSPHLPADSQQKSQEHQKTKTNKKETFASEDDVKIDIDYARVNLLFADGFLQSDDRKAVGRDMVAKVCTPSFLSLLGSNAMCKQHPPWYDLAKLKNRFSTGKNFNTVGRLVPQDVSTWEIVVMAGTVELSISMQTVDAMYLDDNFHPDNTNDDAAFTVQHVVNTMKDLGYYSCELNPNWARDRVLFTPGCLDSHNVTFVHVLIAMLSARPLMIGMVLLVGAKSPVLRDADISMMNAVEHLFAWMLEVQAFHEDFEAHLVRLDFGFSQPAVHYPVRWASTAASVKRKKVFVDMPNDKKGMGYRVEKLLFSIFNAAEEHGGVNIKFLKPFGELSPAPVVQVKSYVSIAHFVRSIPPFCNVNMTNHGFAKKTVKETKAYGYTCYLMLHNVIQIIITLGIIARFEVTMESAYDHYDKNGNFVKIPANIHDMKIQDLSVWLDKAKWAYRHLIQGNLNMTILSQSQCPTVDELLEVGYFKIGQLFAEIQRRNATKIAECVPQPSGQIWLNSVLAMIQAVCGISGNSIHKNWKKPFDAPADYGYDPSGEIYLSNSTNSHLYTNKFKMANKLGQRKINMSRMQYFQSDLPDKTLSFHRDVETQIATDEKTRKTLVRKSKYVRNAVRNEWVKKRDILTAALRNHAAPMFKLMRLGPLYIAQREMIERVLPRCAWTQNLDYEFDKKFIMVIPPRTCGTNSTKKGIKHVIKQSAITGVEDIISEMKTYAAPVTPDNSDRDMHQPTMEAMELMEAAADIEGLNFRYLRREKYSIKWYQFHALKVIQSNAVFKKKVRLGKQVNLRPGDINPETPTLSLSRDATTMLTNIAEVSTTKDSCFKLGNLLGIFTKDLKDKKKPPSDFLVRIWQCYENKFPSIYELLGKSYYCSDYDDPDDDGSDDDAVQTQGQGGYGEDGRTSLRDLDDDVLEWIRSQKQKAQETRVEQGIKRTNRKVILDKDREVLLHVTEMTSMVTATATFFSNTQIEEQAAARAENQEEDSIGNDAENCFGSSVGTVDEDFSDEERHEQAMANHCYDHVLV